MIFINEKITTKQPNQTQHKWKEKFISVVFYVISEAFNEMYRQQSIEW